MTPPICSRSVTTLSTLVAIFVFTIGCAGEAGSPSQPEAPSTIVSRVTIEPETLTIVDGENAGYVATAYDARGAVLPMRTTVTIVDMLGQPPRLSPAGGPLPGMYYMIAAATGETRAGADTLRLRVLPRIVLFMPAVELPLAVGDTTSVPYSLRTLLDSAPVMVTIPKDPAYRIRFSVRDESVASVDSITGLVRARRAGARTTLTAYMPKVGRSNGPVTRTIDLTTRDSTTGTFGIDVRFADNVPDFVRDAARRAARRWAQVIRTDVPDVHVRANFSSSCTGCPTAIDELVDDVVVFIGVSPIDGASGIAGQASPLVVRQGTRLPAAGAVTADVMDIAALRVEGTLESMLVHEIGHALGIGTTWQSPSPDLVAGRSTADPRFIGQQAAQAAASMGVISSAAAGIPVSTDRAHWNYTYMNLGTWDVMGVAVGPQVLTSVTAASMADLGYGISLAGADLPALLQVGTVAAPATSTGVVRGLGCGAGRPPEWVVSPDGTIHRP